MGGAGTRSGRPPFRVGIAADHAGFELKQHLVRNLQEDGVELIDFGAAEFDASDDYPDYVIPLARAIARGEVDRGIACCGSGVGASVAANKVAGVRAALISDVFSAHQGVEDDDLNILCLGGRVMGPSLAWDLTKAFLSARFAAEERFVRRLHKIAELEGKQENKT
jgi:ribose 5-phosphate isomerase B